HVALFYQLSDNVEVESRGTECYLAVVIRNKTVACCDRTDVDDGEVAVDVVRRRQAELTSMRSSDEFSLEVRRRAGMSGVATHVGPLPGTLPHVHARESAKAALEPRPLGLPHPVCVGARQEGDRAPCRCSGPCALVRTSAHGDQPLHRTFVQNTACQL